MFSSLPWVVIFEARQGDRTAYKKGRDRGSHVSSDRGVSATLRIYPPSDTVT